MSPFGKREGPTNPQIVHYTGEACGSIDWELSKRGTDALNALPEGQRNNMREKLTQMTAGHLALLIAALQTENPSDSLV